jgi:hypothetical protein
VLPRGGSTLRREHANPSPLGLPIRLGKIDSRTAEGVKLHVVRLLQAQVTGMPFAKDTADWIRGIGDDLQNAFRGHICAIRDRLPCGE